MKYIVQARKTIQLRSLSTLNCSPHSGQRRRTPFRSVFHPQNLQNRCFGFSLDPRPMNLFESHHHFNSTDSISASETSQRAYMRANPTHGRWEADMLLAKPVFRRKTAQKHNILSSLWFSAWRENQQRKYALSRFARKAY